jgi:hypothetical protein
MLTPTTAAEVTDVQYLGRLEKRDDGLRNELKR